MVSNKVLLGKRNSTGGMFVGTTRWGSERRYLEGISDDHSFDCIEADAAHIEEADTTGDKIYTVTAGDLAGEPFHYG